MPRHVFRPSLVDNVSQLWPDLQYLAYRDGNPRTMTYTLAAEEPERAAAVTKFLDTMKAKADSLYRRAQRYVQTVRPAHLTPHDLGLLGLDRGDEFLLRVEALLDSLWLLLADETRAMGQACQFPRAGDI